MGRHEIRLRRQRMTSHGADRYRNYNILLKRHERNKRMKKVFWVFALFAIVLFLITVMYLLGAWEKRSATAIEWNYDNYVSNQVNFRTGFKEVYKGV
ncbi:MAG: hypothetical protein HC811_11005 [Flammeovirgaceae bacterium]|nr:hypothetical protein [Flammeovirgaceae bacterium]